MKRITLTFLCMVFFTVIACAQRPTIEYGSPSELKGVTKIFIDTGTELEVRSNIIKEINKSQKKMPNLIVVNSPEEADVILVFAADSSSYMSGVTTNPPIDEGGATTSTPTYRTVVAGGGYVIKPVSANRVRILMDFGDSRTTRFERRPSTNFARKFVKEYLKANSETKQP